METQYRVDRLSRAFNQTAPGPQRVAAASRITRVWRAQYRSPGGWSRRARSGGSTGPCDASATIYWPRAEILEGDASATRKLQALERIERLGPRVDRLTRRLSKAAGINQYGILE